MGKNLLKFVKDEPMICVIFIVILTVVCERGMGGIALISPLVPQAMVNVNCCVMS